MNPPAPSAKPKLKPRWTPIVARLVVFGAVAVGLSQYQWFLDEYALQTYHAPAEVASLMSPLGLTRAGQALFARSRPQIDDKATFNHDCQTQQGALELGCYSNGRIYILRIDNVSLKPEMQTVMAHELLHAAWSRLGAHEQTTLGNELEPIYHSLDDADLNERMAGYAKSEPGEETNELHSILGTEQANLTPDLEAHYAKYFQHRGTIVAAHNSYQSVFANLRQQLESQLGVIKQLKAQLTALNARMDNYRSRGQIAAYNSLVASQNQLVDQVNGLIDSYDTGVDEYNALSASIDSNQLTTEPGV